jgi:broad specificity phosphatase PhoE/ribonuclease HI
VSQHVIVEADGGSRGNPGPAGYGAVVRDAASGRVLHEVAAGIGVASNNVAEYRGLIAGLEAAAEVGATDVDVRMDSLLVVNQMSEKWKIKHEAMRPLASQAAGLVRRFRRVSFQHIPREQNKHADRLANEAMDAAAAGLEWTASAEVPEPEPKPRATYGWSAPTTTPTKLLLLRHGETPLSIEKRFSGRGNPDLTDRGRAQASAAAGRLAGRGVDVVVTSPLARARQTADAVGEALGIPVAVEDGFAETDFGEWEGLTFGQVRERWPEDMKKWLSNPAVAPPGGESFAATAQRVGAARERLVSSYDGSTVVVVSHVTPIKLVIRDALGAPMDVLFRIHLETASMSEVDWFADGNSVVRSLNDVAHLETQLRTE